MSDEEQAPPVVSNGVNNAGGGAGDSDDEDPSKLRPVNIEQDVREMERRKRVEAIMSSKLFREELEKVVSDSLRDSGADGISNMISEMMSMRGTPAPAARGIRLCAYQSSVTPSTHIGVVFFYRRSMCDSHQRHPWP